MTSDIPPALLPEILRPNLDVIFVGAAPSMAAAATGHYYAGGRNRFWLLLHQSGFTPRVLRPDEDIEVLEFGVGLTGVLLGHISTSNDLLPPPTEAERAALFDRLARCAPRIICYNGRDVYRMCFGEDAPRWGLLDEPLGPSLQYVVHSSSGRADRWGADRLFLWRELRSLVGPEATGQPSGPRGRRCG
jgi:double-stranded uracil-DNA glycosylase